MTDDAKADAEGPPTYGKSPLESYYEKLYPGRNLRHAIDEAIYGKPPYRKVTVYCSGCGKSIPEARIPLSGIVETHWCPPCFAKRHGFTGNGKLKDLP